MRRSAWLTCLLLSAAAAHAQVREAVVLRDGILQTVVERAGTGVIRGRVFGPNGRTIARAQLRLVETDSGRGVGFAATDEDGRYEFSSLAAGSYRVTAGKPGYLVMEYGQQRAFERGTLVTVRDAEVVGAIDISLPQHGSISGRLVDDNGDAVEDAMVQLFQIRFVDGRQQLVPVPGVAVRTSNDLGRYRLFGIPPGQYVVGAATNLTVSRNVTDGIPGFAPAYAPGTPNAAEARLVSVDLSQEVSDVDITFLPITTARVSGTAVSSTGVPLHPNGTFSLNATQRSGALAAAPMRGNLNAAGEFDIKNVPPGDYVLQVVGQRNRDADEGEFAAQFLTIAGRDTRDLHLRAAPGSRLAGRVVFEGTSGALEDLLAGSSRGSGTTTLAALERRRIEVTTVPIDLDQAPLGGHVARHAVDAQGRFDLRGLTGRRLIRLAREPAGWVLKAVLVNGVDVTDTPLGFGTSDESLDGVEIVLTRRISEVSGRISDARGRPQTAYVAVFSSDRDRWTPASRFVKFARSAVDGTFLIRGLPPGDYHVVAVDRMLEGIGEWQDPEFLESVAPVAARIRLGEGQQVSINPRFLVRQSGF
jgi:hypothetical protein